jgi:hypothetical protein
MSDKVLGGDNDLAQENDGIEVVVVCQMNQWGYVYPPAYSLYDSQKSIVSRYKRSGSAVVTCTSATPVG